MPKKCSVCGRVMTEDECGDVFDDERVCDGCAGICPVCQSNLVDGVCIDTHKVVLMLTNAQIADLRNILDTFTGDNQYVSDLDGDTMLETCRVVNDQV